MVQLSKEMKEKKQRLQNRLELYYQAEEKVLAGQSFTIGSRSLTRANLADIQTMIADLESKIKAIDETGTEKRRVVRVIPRDF